MIPLATVLIVVAFFYLFTNIVVYLGISVVLALLGAPVMKFLGRIKFGKKKMPDAISAFLTLCAIYFSVFLPFYLFIPLFVKEAKFLYTLNFGDVFRTILDQFPTVRETVLNFGSEEQVRDSVIQQADSLLDLKNFGSMVNDAASIGGTLAGGLLAVSFITYFLLKEETMVYRMALLITPSQYEGEMKDILRTTRKMLTKYFAGLFLDVVIVGLIVSLSMYFFGVRNAIFIGVFAGIMNIIPYIGPLISFLFAMFLGVTGCFEYNEVSEISGVVAKIFFIMLAVNLVDGIVFQPLIFSKSVKAHPLEIFLVILMAATLGGIVGMVIAIPTYTLLRIIAKEFLSSLKFFRKISEDIPE